MENINIYYDRFNNNYIFIKEGKSVFSILDRENEFILVNVSTPLPENLYKISPVFEKIEDYELCFRTIDYLFFNKDKKITNETKNIFQNILNKMDFFYLKNYFGNYKKNF